MKISQWLLGAIALGAAGAASARVVAVYEPSGDPASMDALRDLAWTVIEGGAGESDRFVVKVGEGNTLTPDFSVSPGTVAYIWTEESFDNAPGFETNGECMFFEAGYPEKALAKAALGMNEAPAKAWATGLQHVMLGKEGLRLQYSLKEPAQVSVELYEIGGRTLGNWKWKDGAAGSFEKSFALPAAARGTVFVRWKTGGMQLIRKIRVQ